MLDVTGALRDKSPERVALVRDYLLGMAARSRTDLATFHEFVMRDVATQERIVTQPYQRLVFDFWEACPYNVTMLPPGFGKTEMLKSRTLWRIGNEVTRRCMYLSGDTDKARGFVIGAKTLVESSSELRLVFPKLRPTQHSREPWTQSMIVVDRPLGITHPTLVAASEQMGIQGFRLSDTMVDDVLNQNNTRTKEGREKMWRQHSDVLLHRNDQGPKAADTRFIVTNTAWHQEDYLHRLMDDDRSKWGVGWAALLIDVHGNVYVRNVPTTQWDPAQLVPAKCNVGADGSTVCAEGPFRIKAADEAYAAATGDDPERCPLWWPRWTHEAIAKKESVMNAMDFNQAYLLKCRSEETARCKTEWLDACVRKGQETGHHSMVFASPEHPYTSPTHNPIVIGVDLAFGVGEEHDSNSIGVWEVMGDDDPKGAKSGDFKLLWIRTFQASMPDVMEVIYERYLAFGMCHCMVESNSGQDMMRQFLLKKNASMNVRAFVTSGAGAMNKWDRVSGVESLFTMVKNAAWILPCKPGEAPHKEVRKLIEACAYYLPSAHTPDELMGAWFAIWWGRKLHAWAQQEKGGGSGLASATAR